MSRKATFKEAVKRTKRRIDPRRDIRRRSGGSARLDQLPEHAVIVVTTTIIPDATISRIYITDNVHQTFAFDIHALESFIQLPHISGVVLVMMDHHGLLVDVGLQCVVCIGQVGQCEHAADPYFTYGHRRSGLTGQRI